MLIKDKDSENGERLKADTYDNTLIIGVHVKDIILLSYKWFWPVMHEVLGMDTFVMI